MKLFVAPSACSLSPHIILRELDLPFELVGVDLQTKKTASGDDFNAINPKSVVPALQLDDGEVLTEGVAITQFLADHYAPGTLAPAAGTVERARLTAHLNFISAELHPAFKPFFNPAISPDMRQQAIEEVGRKLAVMELALSDGRPFLLGEAFSLADAFLFVMTTWVTMLGVGDISKWPKVRYLKQRVEARATLKAALAAETKLRTAA
jgi:glutathione S-transferase